MDKWANFSFRNTLEGNLGGGGGRPFLPSYLCILSNSTHGAQPSVPVITTPKVIPRVGGPYSGVVSAVARGGNCQNQALLLAWRETPCISASRLEDDTCIFPLLEGGNGLHENQQTKAES